MKHFLRRLIMLAAVAGVVVRVKDRVSPTGEHAPAGSPGTRPANTAAGSDSSTGPEHEEAQTTPTTEDDLTRVKGIGPVYQTRLAGQGITSFRDLADADAAGIAGAIDASVRQIEDWQERASTLD